MIHLAKSCINDFESPRLKTACGNWETGDRITVKRELCTCSSCLMPSNYAKYEAYMDTIKMPTEKK